jgi:hypothetical protein
MTQEDFFFLTGQKYDAPKLDIKNNLWEIYFSAALSVATLCFLLLIVETAGFKTITVTVFTGTEQGFARNK